MKSFMLAIGFLFCALPAFAQTHPCDQVAPTSGTGIAGQTKTLSVCHPGVDPNGNAIDGEKLYDNGGAGTAITMTKGATPNSAGFYEFTAPYVIPSTTGAHSLTVSFLSGPAEGAVSTPFVLTVSLPRVAPVAPTKPQVR